MYYSLSRFVTKVTPSFAGLFLCLSSLRQVSEYQEYIFPGFLFSLVLYIKTERRDFSLVCPTDKQSYK